MTEALPIVTHIEEARLYNIDKFLTHYNVWIPNNKTQKSVYNSS